MEKEKLKELLSKYQTGQCTEQEKAWIEIWYNNLLKDATTGLPEDLVKQDLYNVYHALPQPNKISTGYWLKIAASVLIVLSLSIGLYTSFTKSVQPHTSQASLQANENDFAPEANRTYLTLSDGSKISLERAAIGKIAEQGGMSITKIKEGVIAYKRIFRPRNNVAFPQINTITTSKGGQYQIILPDGSNIWLNALSSLKFPVSFFGGTRMVELKGEGYFEVAKNKALPFKVSTKFQEVEVLGTHFNINSYEDEPATKTTLLEGSVKISQFKTHKSALLKPGQQSTLKDNDIIQVNQIDVNNAIAWKSGLFQFQNSDIQNVLRQLARWYDVDFEFEGPVPNLKLWGEVHRNTNALKVLEILKYFDLKYKIIPNGNRKKIIITK